MGPPTSNLMGPAGDPVPAAGWDTGDLTPAEAGELTKMVQAFAKIIETAELEERVRKLDQQMTLEKRLSKLEASISPSRPCKVVTIQCCRDDEAPLNFLFRRTFCSGAALVPGAHCSHRRTVSWQLPSASGIATTP